MEESIKEELRELYLKREKLALELNKISKEMKEIDSILMEEMINKEIDNIGSISIVRQKRYTINDEEARVKYPNLYEEKLSYSFIGSKKEKDLLVKEGLGEIKEIIYLKDKYIKKE
ncbi:MAG: hypothetical protein EOL97_14665 [Spirochaetia bacterium]|nr:hypothetical protein [Spirochaetia bacterium]